MIQSKASFSFSSLAITAALKIQPLKSYRKRFKRVGQQAEEGVHLHQLLKEMPSSNLTSRWDAGNGFSWR